MSDVLTSFSSAWRERQREYREFVRSRGDAGRYSFVTALLEGFPLNLGHVAHLIADLKRREQDCDMGCLQLVRLLYLMREEPIDGFDRDKLIADLVAFPFWPSTSDKMRGKENRHLVFWSENHVLMCLGSAHLSRQLKAIDHAKALHSKQLELARQESAGDMSIPPIQDSATTTTAAGQEHWETLLTNESAALVASIPGAALEEKLLRHYLQAHTNAAFSGVYEALSHVYLPYTLCALWNLYDFSRDHALRADASALIDAIMKPLLLTTSSPETGAVSTLTASCRSFSRTRQRIRGHNINNLVRMLAGVSPEPLCTSFLSDFLCTTTWQPRAAIVDSFLSFTGRTAVVCSHDSADFARVYSSNDAELGMDELTPFAWSAGLVLHPSFAEQTKRYLAKKHLTANRSLGALRLVPSALAGSLAAGLAHLSAGQSYCGVRLKIFKSAVVCVKVGAGAVPRVKGDGQTPGAISLVADEDKDPSPAPDSASPSTAARPGQVTATDAAGPIFGQIVLTSFDRWNVQKTGFQQLPWALNFAGVGLWSQSGAGSEGVLGFGLTNTHNPCVVQEGSVLLCAYAAPRHLTHTSITSSVLRFGSESWLVWPDVLMDTSALHGPVGDGAAAAADRIEEARGKRWWGSGWWGSGSGSGGSSAGTSGAAANTPGAEDGDGWAAPYSWRVGRRKGCYVGVLCTAETRLCRRPCSDTNMEVVVADIGDPRAKQAAAEAAAGALTNGAGTGAGTGAGSETGTVSPVDIENALATVQSSRLVCRAPVHAWVVVVATSLEFPSLCDFYAQRCLAVEVREQAVKDSTGAVKWTLVDSLEGAVEAEMSV